MADTSSDSVIAKDVLRKCPVDSDRPNSGHLVSYMDKDGINLVETYGELNEVTLVGGDSDEGRGYALCWL